MFRGAGQRAPLQRFDLDWELAQPATKAVIAKLAETARCVDYTRCTPANLASVLSNVPSGR